VSAIAEKMGHEAPIRHQRRQPLGHRNHEQPYGAREGDMFLSKIELLNAAYKRRGEEINYVEQPQTSSVVRDEPWNDES
jgi:hypothetical protein